MLHAFLHPVIVIFSQHMTVPAQLYTLQSAGRNRPKYPFPSLQGSRPPPNVVPWLHLSPRPKWQLEHFSLLVELTAVINRMEHKPTDHKTSVTTGRILCRQQEHVDSKTLHQLNPPVANWRCRLTQVDLYNGHKTVVCTLLLVTSSNTDQFSNYYCMRFHRKFLIKSSFKLSLHLMCSNVTGEILFVLFVCVAKGPAFLCQPIV